MKKLAAILMVLAVFATAAFAEVAVGGTAGAIWSVAGVSAEADPTTTTGFSRSDPAPDFSYGNVNVIVSGSNDDETFGGFVRLDYGSYNFWNHAYAWWQPISQFKLQIGQEYDGLYGADGSVVGWGYHGAASDYVALHNYDRREAFYTGFGAAGPSVSIVPVEGITINAAIPIYDTHPDAGGALVNDPYKHIFGQITYDFPGAGRIALSYAGGANELTWNPAAAAGKELGWDLSAIYAAFHLNSIEGLDISLGGKYSLPVEKDFAGIIGKYVYRDPLYIGLGAAYAAGEFGIKARLTAALGGKTDVTIVTTNTAKIDPLVEASIMPYYDLGAFKIFVDIGIANQKEFDFFINPYVSKTIGNGTFYAGCQIWSNKAAVGDDILWGIPLGIEFVF